MTAAAAPRSQRPPEAAGQAERAQRRGGEPGQEHHLGDGQVGQVGVEDPVGVGRERALHVQRPDLRVRRVVLDRERPAGQRQEDHQRGQRRGEPAGQQRPGGEPERARRRYHRGADRHRPPERAAPRALVRRDRVQDRHAGQVERLRPDRGGRPVGELARPPRHRGHADQVGQAAAPVPRPNPGGGTRQQRREHEHGVRLKHPAADVPERRVVQGRAVGAEPEQRREQRQHPQHRAAAQFDAQQPGRPGRPRKPPGPRCRRGGGRGHDRAPAVARAAVMTGLRRWRGRRPGQRCSRVRAGRRRPRRCRRRGRSARPGCRETRSSRRP